MAHEERFEELQRKGDALAKQVYIRDGSIVVNIQYEYELEISGCSSHEFILAEVKQLLTKNWITCEALEHFIHIALREANLS